MAMRVRHRETGEEKIIGGWSEIIPPDDRAFWEEIESLPSDPEDVLRRWGTGLPASPDRLGKLRDRGRRTHG